MHQMNFCKPLLPTSDWCIPWQCITKLTPGQGAVGHSQILQLAHVCLGQQLLPQLLQQLFIDLRPHNTAACLLQKDLDVQRPLWLP